MDDNKKRTKRNKNPNLRLIKNDSTAGNSDDAALKSTKDKPVASRKEKQTPITKKADSKKTDEKKPKSKPKATKTSEAKAESKSKADKTSGAKAESKSKTDKTSETKAESKPKADKTSEAKAESKSKADKTSETKAESKSKADKTSEAKPESKPKTGRKAAEKPTVKKKKTGKKTTERKNGKKTAAKKTSDAKTAGKKVTDKKTTDKKAAENKPTDKKIADKKEDRKKIISKKSVEKKILYDRKDRNKLEPGEWFVQHRSLVMIGATILTLAAVFVGVYIYIIKTYTVTTVYVDGNVHYTNEEIMGMVMTGRYGNNSLYLAMKYKEKGVEGVPFVEKMDINILAPDTIRINVYEKALAGYVEYLGRYMYFDRDGIVVESSEMKTAGIPQVTGLKFDYVVLNEPLPIENDEIFAKILSITQLLAKYELMADKIFFDSSFDLTLYFEGVKVTLGSDDEIDEKIMKLQYILPELEGKQGTLRMENYTEDTKNITFHQD